MSTQSAPALDLDRFLTAQDDGGFEAALEEIQAGEKRSHWMWFIFPQIAGLGSSTNARKFALADREAAQAYATHDELGPRLYEATEAMLEWAGTLSASDILGAVDAMKFRSSMTLFEAACPDDDAVFADALDQFFEGDRCALTLERI